MKTIAVLALLAAAVSAETPASDNAALGYWRAFSMVKAPESGDPAWEKADDVARGKAAWDEAALGKLVSDNNSAYLELHKASLKPRCDFGLAYEDGFSMTLPHLAKARQLSRLNLLLAAKLEAVGNGAGAVEAWLDGVRLGRHLAGDPVLISHLVANMIFNLHVDALTRYVGRGAAGKPELAAIAAAFAEIPAYGWDWGASIAMEKACAGMIVKEYVQAKDPEKALRDFLAMIEPMDAPKRDADKALADILEGLGVAAEVAKDREKFRGYMKDSLKGYESLMDEVAAALRQRAFEGQPALDRIAAMPKSSNLLIHLLAPATAAVGKNRAQLEAQRAGLIAIVAVARHRSQNGKDPASLEGLGVPEDPYTGKALSMESTVDAVVIRSEGKNAEGRRFEFVLKK